MTTSAQQEVRVLEGRLATAKEKAEKESRADTLATRLALSERAVNDGERQLNLVQQKLREMQSEITGADTASRSGEVSADGRENARIRYFELQNEQQKLSIELSAIQESLAAARGDLAKIRSEIAAHPVFIAAAKEQREICRRGVEVALLVWSGALENTASLNAQLEKLSSEEQAVIGRWRQKLEAEGLPQLRRRIYGQLGNLVPAILLSLDLRRLRLDVEAAIENVLREY